jgi:hypothetical protein
LIVETGSAFKAREIGPEVKINDTTSPLVRHKKKVENMRKKSSF